MPRKGHAEEQIVAVLRQVQQPMRSGVPGAIHHCREPSQRVGRGPATQCGEATPTILLRLSVRTLEDMTLEYLEKPGVSEM